MQGLFFCFFFCRRASAGTSTATRYKENSIKKRLCAYSLAASYSGPADTQQSGGVRVCACARRARAAWLSTATAALWAAIE